jgi:hypothetical protein
VTNVSYEYLVIKDAQTGIDYTTSKTKILVPAVFELCATFDTTRSITQSPNITTSYYPVFQQYYAGDMNPFWNHIAGHVCFTRTITQEVYDRYTGDSGIPVK